MASQAAFPYSPKSTVPAIVCFPRNALKSPFNEVSRDCHGAAQLNLAATDHSRERGAVELSLLGPGEFVAALLQRELLLSNAALIPDRHCPRSLDRHRGRRTGAPDLHSVQAW